MNMKLKTVVFFLGPGKEAPDTYYQGKEILQNTAGSLLMESYKIIDTAYSAKKPKIKEKITHTYL